MGTIIVNKMPKIIMNSMEFLNHGRFEIESCFRKSENLKYSTNHIYYILKDPEMEDKPDAKFSDEESLSLLENILLVKAPSIKSVADAELINVDDIEKRLAASAVKHAEMLEKKRKEWQEKSDAERDAARKKFN